MWICLLESKIINNVGQAKGTYSHYLPEVCEPLVQTDTPALIFLATNVTDTVFEGLFLPTKALYLLDENQDLYIRTKTQDLFDPLVFVTQK
jgi:hypothetical protein